MSPFLEPSYWLTLQPPQSSGLLGNVILGGFLILFVSGLWGQITTRRKKGDRYRREIAGRISTLLITMGFLGLLLSFFSYEGIQLLGARFWYIVWVVVTLAWIIVLGRSFKRDIPAKQEWDRMWRERGRYLPRGSRH